MAVGSTPKRPKQKRRSSDHRKHHNHDDDAATMASLAPQRSRGYGAYLRRGFSAPSAFVVLCLFLLLCVIWKRIPISRLPLHLDSTLSTSSTSSPRSKCLHPEKVIVHHYLAFGYWRVVTVGLMFSLFKVVNFIWKYMSNNDKGLLYGGNDTLFESTGLYSRSSLREVLLQTGKVQVYHQMDGSLFGEGLTLLGERLFQVTWLEKTGFIYDRYNFNKREKFTHQMHDGWGLATDGKILFGSDGSSTLYQIDPLTLKVIKRVTVRYNDHEVPFLNELEYVNGEVWANIWQTDCIARISQEDGLVISWILLHGLRQGLLRSGHTAIDVLNGIAWDKEKNRLFVTGKLWPKLYEIKLRPVTGPSNGRIENLCPIRA